MFLFSLYLCLSSSCVLHLFCLCHLPLSFWQFRKQSVLLVLFFSFLCVYPCLGPMSCLCFCICICLCSCCKFESIFRHLLEAICPVCFMFVFVYMCLSFSLLLPSSTSYSLALSLFVL